MLFSVYVENPKFLDEAIRSRCNSIRFGSDLCELKLPNTNQVIQAHSLVEKANKEFIYVCPRVPDLFFSEVQGHLQALNDAATKPTRVVTNDLGILNQIIDQNYLNLLPHLGRQLVSIPRRGRPSMIELMAGENQLKRFVMGKAAGLVFDKTNLNFKPTLNFLNMHGVQGADVDWIPETFDHLRGIIRSGIAVSVHLQLVFVAIARRCHTARYFHENIPHQCTRPCLKTSMLLKHDVFGDLLMDGNTIFGVVAPTQSNTHKLISAGVNEIVLTMSPITDLKSASSVDQTIETLEAWI